MAKNKKQMTAVCKKNDELQLEIIDMGSQGEGIGRYQGYTLFIKDALPFDVVKVKVMKTNKNFGFARLMEIVKPSPFRVESQCPSGRRCGGCQLQHLAYEKQLSWKQDKIAGCLTRIGGFAPDKIQEIMEPIMGMENPTHYRNKSQYPVGYDKEGNLVAGFYAGRTHDIIPERNCLIGNACDQQIVDQVLSYMKEYGVSAYKENTGTGLVRHILIRVGESTGQIMVCLVINGKSLPKSDKLVQRLLECTPNGTDEKYKITSICLNENREKTNVILGNKVIPLYGETYIEDCIGQVKYRISPLSFYQVNPGQTRKLYDTALNYAGLTGNEKVWDLYCGIGTISLFLSQKADSVFGVEIVPQAIEDAKENAKLNGINNATFFVGAAEEVVPREYEKSDGKLRADVVVVDPPRKGCDEVLLQTLVQMQPEKIVYVSCDPATLARDLKFLAEKGYELQRVRGCDMFGFSYHVETVALLSKKNYNDIVLKKRR